VIEDAKRMHAVYKLEEWEVETFIRLVRDTPSDGFGFVFERIVFEGIPPDCDYLEYSLNDPAAVDELESRWNLEK